MEPISIEVALSLIQALESEIRYLRREVAAERIRADSATMESMRLERIIANLNQVNVED